MSLFIEPAKAAVEAARDLRAPVVELHTGRWCELVESDPAAADAEFARLRTAAALAHRFGIECHAGHGLDYAAAEVIAAVPEIAELNIGHFLVAEAIFVGLPDTIGLMRAAMARGRARAAA